MDNPNFEVVVSAPPVLAAEKHSDASHQLPNHLDDADKPVSKFLKRYFNDPATLKLVVIVIAAFSFSVISPNVNDDSQSFLSHLVNAGSLIYAIFALYITVLSKKHETFQNYPILKTVFRGRNVYWHEFHSSMAFFLVCCNLGCIFFRLSYPRSNVICCLINAMIYYCEFSKAQKISKSFVTEDRVPECSWKFTKFIFGLFKNHPKKFMVFRLVCFIVAFINYIVCYQTEVWLIYYAIACIFGSFFTKNNKNASIIVTTFAFFFVFLKPFQYDYYNYYDNSDFNYRYQSFRVSWPIYFGIFVFSLMELYSQAILNKSRRKTDFENPESKTDHKPTRNLPKIIQNPLGVESGKQKYDYFE